MDCRDVILKTGWVLGRPDHKARWLARIWSSGGELHSNNLSPSPEQAKELCPRARLARGLCSRERQQVHADRSVVVAGCRRQIRIYLDSRVFPQGDGRLARGSGGGSSSKANPLEKAVRMGATC